jgi:tripartite-type tricarboxylate transporter receptor subunit TctC
VSGELFKMMAGVNMVHVPYRGNGPALADLLGGQMQVLFVGPLAAIEYIRTGRLQALAVTSPTRLNALPGIPSLSEFLPGYEADDSKGIGAPKDTPVEIIAKLNEGINTALADPKGAARRFTTPFPGSPADFGKFIAAETEKWGKVIRAANIKPE